MSANSSIEWTDRTWNPTRGCSVISPGCVNCYAMKQGHRFSGPGGAYEGLTKLTKAGPQWTGVVRTVESALLEPLKWRKPQRVFVNSMSDLFHEDVPDAFIDRVFAVMAWTPWHTYQILTKRADRMRSYFQGAWHQRVVAEYYAMRERGEAAIAKDGDRQRVQGYAFGSLTCGDHNERFLPSVWLGVSVENQKFADERIPLLLQTPAAVRFISAEPLLGRVDIRFGRGWQALPAPGPPDPPTKANRERLPGYLHWVIVGGESGNGARPCALEWIESIVSQCKAASVPVFVKQLGAYIVSEQRTMPAGDVFSPAKLKLEDFATNHPDEVWAWRAGTKDRKGGDMAEWPTELRVREFPNPEAA